MTARIKSLLGFLLRLLGGGNESIAQEKQLLEEFELDHATQAAHLPTRPQYMSVVVPGRTATETRNIRVALKENQTHHMFRRQWSIDNPELSANSIFRPNANEIEVR